MKKSENYEMNLPEVSDAFDVEHMNANTKKIDELLKENNDKMQRVLGDIDISCSAIGKLVTITDGSDAPIIYLKENGYTEQFTTTGKNLLNPALQSNTSNGITFTKQSDGSYTMTGTQTDTSTASYVTLIDRLKLPIGRYKLSGGVNSKIYIRLIVTTDEGNKNIYSNGEDVGFSIESENSTASMLLVVTAGTTPQGTFYPMIRKAEITDNTYEQYTGGIASPNPDYPQEIVGMDKVSVKTCGKNLLKSTLQSNLLFEYFKQRKQIIMFFSFPFVNF